jgi:hypothetical protein
MGLFDRFFGKKPPPQAAAGGAPRPPATPPMKSPLKPPIGLSGKPPAPPPAKSPENPRGKPVVKPLAKPPSKFLAKPTRTPEPVEPETQLLAIEGPIWANPDGPFSKILGAKGDDAVEVAFLGGSLETSPQEEPAKAVAVPADLLARLARALPLFLTERIHLKTSTKATSFIPRQGAGGLTPSPTPWSLRVLATLKRKPDYVVFLHLVAGQGDARMQFSLKRVADEQTIATWEQPIDPANVNVAIHAAARRALSEVAWAAKVPLLPGTDGLFAPTSALLARYVAALDHALAAHVTGQSPGPVPTANPDDSQLEDLLELCLRETDNAAMRMLLLSTIERASRAQPGMAKKYRQRLELLQRQYPLRQPAKGLTDAVLAKVQTEP